MSTINIHNCEAFFLDFYEGNLSAEQQLELQHFLNHHPEWKQEFEEYGTVTDAEIFLSPEHPALDVSEILKADDDLIELLEGTLSASDTKSLEEKITQDAALEKEYRLYQKTRLHPDLSIRFPQKSRLKKFAPVIPMLARYSSVAALLSGAVFMIWLFNNTEPAGNLSEIPVAEPVQKAPLQLPELKVSVAEPTIITSEPIIDSSTAVRDHREEPAVQPQHGQINQDLAESVAEPTQPKNPVELIPVRSAGLLAIEIQSPKLAAVSGTMPQPIVPEYPEEETDLAQESSSKSLLGILVSHVGQALVDKVKNISEENLLIEQHETVDEEVYSSTFKLGALEVYRSKSRK